MRVAVKSSPAVSHKPLKTSFRSKGFDYRQVERIGDVALFEQSKPTMSDPRYEVVLVQRHDGYEIGGKRVEPSEVMPNASQWGRLGWTFNSEKQARDRFDELVKRADEAA